MSHNFTPGATRKADFSPDSFARAEMADAGISGFRSEHGSHGEKGTPTGELLGCEILVKWLKMRAV
jgi:hypothetical protein